MKNDTQMEWRERNAKKDFLNLVNGKASIDEMMAYLDLMDDEQLINLHDWLAQARERHFTQKVKERQKSESCKINGRSARRSKRTLKWEKWETGKGKHKKQFGLGKSINGGKWSNAWGHSNGGKIDKIDKTDKTGRSAESGGSSNSP